MPGTGPAPKPPEQRRNRNHPQRGEWVDITVPELPKAAHPPLSKLKVAKGVKWSAACRELWSIWTHDPASVYWSTADVAYAVQTLHIFLDAEPRPRELANGEVVELPGEMPLSEVSRRLDRLGLTPKGKRDLRYRITFAPWRDTTLDVPAEPQGPGGDNVSSLDARRSALATGA